MTHSLVSLYFLKNFSYTGSLVMVIAVVLFSLSYFLVTRSFVDSSVSEKLSSYECGFSPFQDTRSYFDVRFYIVGILFIIFDIELALLFVWCVIAEQIGLQGYLVVFAFIYLILVGYIYEMIVGALDFE